jgi:hypothetical protein
MYKLCETIMATRPNTPDELAVLESALHAFRALGLKADVRKTRKGEAQLQLQYGQKTITRIPNVRRNVGKTTLGPIAHQLAQTDAPLLVTEYVAPELAERLRELNIQFIDTAGNVYVEAPPLLIWVTGRKLERLTKGARPTRAFQPGGLRLIFALLCNPELVNTAYRNMAEAANVANGTVGWVMKDLKEARFLVDLGKGGRKLVNRRKLLDQWVEGYAGQLRPKLITGRLRALEPARLKDAHLIPAALWGGETAAAKLTRYLKPAVQTIYLPKDTKAQAQLMKELRLIKDPAGEVELREKFWRFEWPEYPDLVPPLLIYADLLATADDRNIETARMIYDEHLAGLIGTY